MKRKLGAFDFKLKLNYFICPDIEMLSQMLKQHQETMKGRMETQEKLKKEAVESANELTANLVRIFLSRKLDNNLVVL